MSFVAEAGVVCEGAEVARRAISKHPPCEFAKLASATAVSAAEVSVACEDTGSRTARYLAIESILTHIRPTAHRMNSRSHPCPPLRGGTIRILMEAESDSDGRRIGF